MNTLGPEYKNRRARLMQKIGPRSVFIVVAAPTVNRNGNDMDYPYRQHSDFYYLTGFDEPEAVALLIPGREAGEFVLFNQIRKREEEIWTGYRAGQEGAQQKYGADQAFPISELKTRLPQLIEGCVQIHYEIGINLVFDQLLMEVCNVLRKKVRDGVLVPLVFTGITPTLHEMRLIKDETEIALMRKAAEITAAGHARAMQVCKPGVNEYHLEAELTYAYQQRGARFHAYNPIVGSGCNTCILHYNQNNRTIEEGDMVLIDSGAEYQYYACDVTRSFPANGRFSREQRLIYELVLQAQLAGIETMKPGNLWSRTQEVMVRILTEGLIELGILSGAVDELVEKGAYFSYYMHKSGHWLGLDTHDVGRYKLNNQWRLLEPGMVVTVEPGLYLAADIPGLDPRWHNIGVRIEDDVLITEQGCEVLTRQIPKTIKEIESLMASSA